MRFLIALLLTTALWVPASLRAADVVEEAGVGVGLTAGNMIYVPMKAISLGWGLFESGISFVLSGGNAKLSKQILENTQEGPYLITPEVARKAIGSRPELDNK